MTNVVFQQAPHEDADFVRHLEELGFERIVLGQRRKRFGGKLALFLQAARSSVRLLARTNHRKRLGTVVALGHFAFAVKVLARLGLLHYERLFCSGFFVRSPAWFPLFRVLKLMDTRKDHYLIFSRSELPLYADRVGIDRKRLHYIPCGDWHEAETTAADPCQSRADADYYFSGGYSNRDYVSLIRVFEKIRLPLLIVCSRLNVEVDDKSLPANVRVVRDVTSDAFDLYISRAKAGIIPLKHDTGSAGQTVVLRLMRQAKPVVVNDFGAVRDYVEPGQSGYLVRDLAADLPEVIASIEADPEAAAKVGEAARAKYQDSFSRVAISERLQQILRETGDALE